MVGLQVKRVYLFEGESNRCTPREPRKADKLKKILNEVLANASGLLQKYIRARLFRVTRVSNLLQNADIEPVRQIISHANVK